MARHPYYASDNPTAVVRGASWRTAVWIVCAVAFFSAVSIGIWAFQVGTSDVKGRGDATQKVNSGDNRLAQQAYFEQTYADIQAADRKLDQLAADKAAHVDGADVRYSGAVSYCIQLVADYDAAARKQVADRFRAVDLPARIDTTAAATDCAPKETPQ